MTHPLPPLGEPLPDWRPPPAPPRAPLDGRYCRLEPLTAAHAAALHAANAEDGAGRMWDYMPYGPFADSAAYDEWVDSVRDRPDPMFLAIRDETGTPSGVASYLRVAPEAGSIEVGHIAFAPRLQRTRAGSEAIILMARQAFALGYRRFEWKCNALNRASRGAAIRYGFSYEGIFRQATVSKGRNRDTAWFAMIDREAPALETAWRTWLDADNFDAAGRQRTSLGALTAPILAATDPETRPD